MSALSLSGALLPVLMAQGVNVVTGVAANREAIATVLVVLVIAIGVLNWGINWARRMLTARLLGDVVLSMRVDAFRAVMNHDMSFFDKNQSGRIVSRITTDTDEFSRGQSWSQRLAHSCCSSRPAHLSLHRQLAAYVVALALLAPVAMIVAPTFQRWARRYAHQPEAVADVNASIQEAVTGIRVAKNFRRDGDHRGVSGRQRTSYTRCRVRRGFVLALIFPTLQLFAGLGTAVLLLYAGGYYSTYLGHYQWRARTFLHEQREPLLVSMINLGVLEPVSGPLSAHGTHLCAHRRSRPAVDRRDHQAITAPAATSPSMSTFATARQVLSDFSLHIRPGESVALVGPHGRRQRSRHRQAGGAPWAAGRHHCSSTAATFRTFDLRTLPPRQLGIVNERLLSSGTVADNILRHAGSRHRAPSGRSHAR